MYETWTRYSRIMTERAEALAGVYSEIKNDFLGGLGCSTGLFMKSEDEYFVIPGKEETYFRILERMHDVQLIAETLDARKDRDAPVEYLGEAVQKAAEKAAGKAVEKGEEAVSSAMKKTKTAAGVYAPGIDPEAVLHNVIGASQKAVSFARSQYPGLVFPNIPFWKAWAKAGAVFLDVFRFTAAGVNRSAKFHFLGFRSDAGKLKVLEGDSMAILRGTGKIICSGFDVLDRIPGKRKEDTVLSRDIMRISEENSHDPYMSGKLAAERAAEYLCKEEADIRMLEKIPEYMQSDGAKENMFACLKLGIRTGPHGELSYDPPARKDIDALLHGTEGSLSAGVSSHIRNAAYDALRDEVRGTVFRAKAKAVKRQIAKGYVPGIGQLDIAVVRPDAAYTCPDTIDFCRLLAKHDAVDMNIGGGYTARCQYVPSARLMEISVLKKEDGIFRALYEPDFIKVGQIDAIGTFKTGEFLDMIYDSLSRDIQTTLEGNPDREEIAKIFECLTRTGSDVSVEKDYMCIHGYAGNKKDDGGNTEKADGKNTEKEAEKYGGREAEEDAVKTHGTENTDADTGCEKNADAVTNADVGSRPDADANTDTGSRADAGVDTVIPLAGKKEYTPAAKAEFRKNKQSIIFRILSKAGVKPEKATEFFDRHPHRFGEDIPDEEQTNVDITTACLALDSCGLTDNMSLRNHLAQCTVVERGLVPQPKTLNDVLTEAMDGCVKEAAMTVNKTEKAEENCKLSDSNGNEMKSADDVFCTKDKATDTPYCEGH